MPGGYASVPLKYIILRGQTMIQDHEPTVINNYPIYQPDEPQLTAAEAFSAPELVYGGEGKIVQYEYLVSFLHTEDHIHADHVDLGETWTILYIDMELEDGSHHHVRSARRTALIDSVDRVPKTLIDKEADAAIQKGLDDILKEGDK